jgi:hypothetical protein
MHNRALTTLAATLAGLALLSAPAFAGEDDDGDDDDRAPAPAVQNVPAPESAAPAGAPRGGVATGLGGTADDDAPSGALIGLAGGLLLTGTGGLVAVRRRS